MISGLAKSILITYDFLSICLISLTLLKFAAIFASPATLKASKKVACVLYAKFMSGLPTSLRTDILQLVRFTITIASNNHLFKNQDICIKGADTKPVRHKRSYRF